MMPDRVIWCPDEKAKPRVYHFYDHGRLVKVMTGDDPLDDDALLAWFKGGPLP